MSGAVNALTVIDLLFILLLSVAGSFSQMGAVYGILYVLAFAIPLALGLFLFPKFKRAREEERGLAESVGSCFSLSGRAVLSFIPTVFPTVAIIFLCSLLTSLVLGAMGFADVADYSNVSILRMMLENALVPAILEELLFRFVPLLLLCPYSKRGCVLVSAIFFAMIHGNFFSMPYAFLAGTVFMTLDIAYGSVVPSMVLHFANNAVSVLWMKLFVPEDILGISLFAVTLFGLALLSFAVIFVKRREYAALLKSGMSKGERIKTYSPFIIIAIGMLSGVANLMGQLI